MDSRGGVLLGILCGLSVLSLCSGDCGLPAVPAHATIQFDSFPVRAKTVATYACDPGFILLGKDSRSCSLNGTWTGFTPLCVVDVALGKPSKSSSQQGLIGPSIAVSGDSMGMSSEEVCHTTKPEVAPWWSVNLLESYVIHSVRLVVGQSCCADGPVYIEVRVGNDRDISRNALCGRYNGILEDGLVLDVRCYRPLRGIFLSVHQLREVPNSLSLCRVQAFSDQAITTLQCPIAEEKVDMGDVFTYSDQCYHFFNSKPDTWDNAQMYCQRRGGSLVWGTSPAFQAFVSWSMAHRYNQFSAENPNYWMGAVRSDWTNGEWMWVKGNTTINPVRAFWSSRDPPGDFNGLQSCVMFDANSGWLWRETSCNRHLNWVCEFTPRSCGNPAVQANSSVQYSSTDVGSVAVYGCTGGLYLRGPSLRRCQPNGKWSDQPPVCTMDGCGIPIPIENGEASYNRTSVGAVAEYSCAPRYKPIGQTTMRCNAEGNWDVEPPQCILIDCGPPPSIPHGSATLLDRETSEGSKLEYHCDSGYSLVGNNRLVCSGNEVWEGAIAFCQLGGVSQLPATFFAQPEKLGTFGVQTASDTTTRPTKLKTVPATLAATTTTTLPSTTTTTTATTTESTTLPTTTTTTTTTTPTTTSTTTTTTTTTTESTTTESTTPVPTTLSSTSQERSSPSSRWVASTYDAFPSTLPDRISQETSFSSTGGSSNPAVIETSSGRPIPVGWDTSSSSPTTWETASSTRTSSSETQTSSSSAATMNQLASQTQRNENVTTVAPLNGTIIFNNSDRALLEGLANQFAIFTASPMQTSSHMPVLHGRFQANNAIMRAPNVPFPYPSSSSRSSEGSSSTIPSVSVSQSNGSSTQGSNGSRIQGSMNVGVGSPYEHKLPEVVDNEPYDEKNNVGRRRLANGLTEVVTATDVILPTTAQASKGVGGWIALGVVLGLVLLFLLLILIACLIRRRRSRSTRVELTSNIPVTQYDTEQHGNNSAVFSSRYRKAWDNLQFQVADAGTSGSGTAGGKDTPISHTTFQSTGPRRRDEIAVKAGSEIMVSPSRAGTMKSVGGTSEAYHGSEEILIDDATTHPVHRNAGNSPDVVEVIHSLPRPQLL